MRRRVWIWSGFTAGAGFSSAGITDDSISLVFAEVDGTPGNRQNADSEDSEIFLMDRPAVHGLLQRRGIFFGARAWLAMDAYSRAGENYLLGSAG